MLEKLVEEKKYDAIINCIGLLNQDAENNKHLAVYLNSYLPHLLSYLTRDLDTKVIQMSTDCVFSGKSGNYNENSLRDGETFYDRSKALGELENDKDLTFRDSIIGPDINRNGIGLFNWFMKQNGEIYGYTKAIWTGVTTLTLAKAMERAVQDNLTGLYNLVNNDSLSKYEMLLLFNEHFRENKLIIYKSDKVNLNKFLVLQLWDNDAEIVHKGGILKNNLVPWKAFLLARNRFLQLRLFPFYQQVIIIILHFLSLLKKSIYWVYKKKFDLVSKSIFGFINGFWIWTKDIFNISKKNEYLIKGRQYFMRNSSKK